MSGPVLDVADLRVRIGRREIVRGSRSHVAREQTLGIVGESGSGKSMTVLAATGLLDAPGAVVTGIECAWRQKRTADAAGRRVGPYVAQRSRRPGRVRVSGPGDVAQPAADPGAPDHRIA